MALDIRPVRPDEVTELITVDYRNFGATVETTKVDQLTRHLDLDRFLVIVDDGRIVGGGGSYEFDVTVPGGATVPMAGVAWVSVAASHRRRGLLTRLMAALDAQAADRHEPMLGLLASEGAIYERFGYGVSNRTRVVEIDRRHTGIHPRWRPDSVELIDGQDHVDELVALWDRYRATRPGELSRTADQFRGLVLDGDAPAFAARHPDGYALYSITPDWADGRPAHVLTVGDFAAVTPEAHLALWHLLLSVDLVGPIRSYRAVAVDDPLPSLLTEPRALGTTALNDGLWCKVTDPVRCFAARAYRSDDHLTVGVVESVDDLLAGAEPLQRFTVGPDGVEATDGEPDLMTCRPALGPLLLGGQPTELARARRLVATPDVLARGDALFGWSPMAHTSLSF